MRAKAFLILFVSTSLLATKAWSKAEHIKFFNLDFVAAIQTPAAKRKAPFDMKGPIQAAFDFNAVSQKVMADKNLRVYISGNGICSQRNLAVRCWEPVSDEKGIGLKFDGDSRIFRTQATAYPAFKKDLEAFFKKTKGHALWKIFGISDAFAYRNEYSVDPELDASMIYATYRGFYTTTKTFYGKPDHVVANWTHNSLGLTYTKRECDKADFTGKEVKYTDRESDREALIINDSGKYLVRFDAVSSENLTSPDCTTEEINMGRRTIDRRNCPRSPRGQNWQVMKRGRNLICYKQTCVEKPIKHFYIPTKGPSFFKCGNDDCSKTEAVSKEVMFRQVRKYSPAAQKELDVHQKAVAAAKIEVDRWSVNKETHDGEELAKLTHKKWDLDEATKKQTEFLEKQGKLDEDAMEETLLNVAQIKFLKTCSKDEICREHMATGDHKINLDPSPGVTAPADGKQ
jgi:hypothetical protein